MAAARASETVPGVLEVRRCPHGRGVFALRDFAKGETVSIVIGGEFTAKPWSTDGHALRIGDSLYWDEATEGSQTYWSNFLDHRQDPNCRFVDFDPGLPGARLVAVLEVSKGEELFLNYREYYPDNPVSWS